MENQNLPQPPLPYIAKPSAIDIFKEQFKIIFALPYHFVYFFWWWYIQRTIWFFNFFKKTLILILDSLGTISMAQNLFTPYRKDRTWIGRIMGFIVRFIWLIGSIPIIILIAFTLVIMHWFMLLMPLWLPMAITLDTTETLHLVVGILGMGISIFVYLTQFIIQPRESVDHFVKRRGSLNDLYRVMSVSLKRAIFLHATFADYHGIEKIALDTLVKRLFHASLVQKVYNRLNLNPNDFLEHYLNVSLGADKSLPNTRQVIEAAFDATKQFHPMFLGVEDVLYGLFLTDPRFEQTFIDLEINRDDLAACIYWVLEQERAKDKWKYWNNPHLQLQTGVDRAFVAGWTPTMKHFITDITKDVAKGRIHRVVGRGTEIEKLENILSRSKNSNAVLVGEPGVGRTSIVHAVAFRIMQGLAPKALDGKRIVQVNLGTLMAGAGMSGELERRLVMSLQEATAAHMILYLPNLENLMGTGAQGGTFDVASIVLPYISDGRLQVIASTTQAEFLRHVEQNPDFSNLFEQIPVKEPEPEEVVKILQNFSPALEQEHKITITYPAIEAAIDLSRRYIHDRVLPEKALDILDEAAVAGAKSHKKNIDRTQIENIVAIKTGIPIAKITEQESQKLLNLEHELHQRVIGQDNAIIAVSNALRRARTGMRSEDRPIANFLFVGPTGVGKTETAKALSDIYFGNENAMIRLDMSEYQNSNSISRLIGSPPGFGEFQEGGQLTESVRHKPFTLVLLDEIEKAHSEILNIFLQVFDDGRLTDNKGRTVSFQETIIIATSNAVTDIILSNLQSSRGVEALDEQISEGLKRYFRPEFLNRFDGIIMFKPLTIEQVRQIALLMLTKVQKRLSRDEITINFTQDVVDALVKIGYSQQFGARPMRRAIQDHIENTIARWILGKQIKRGDKVVFSQEHMAYQE